MAAIRLKERPHEAYGIAGTEPLQKQREDIEARDETLRMLKNISTKLSSSEKRLGEGDDDEDQDDTDEDEDDVIDDGNSINHEKSRKPSTSVSIARRMSRMRSGKDSMALATARMKHTEGDSDGEEDALINRNRRHGGTLAGTGVMTARGRSTRSKSEKVLSIKDGNTSRANTARSVRASGGGGGGLTSRSQSPEKGNRSGVTSRVGTAAEGTRAGTPGKPKTSKKPKDPFESIVIQAFPEPKDTGEDQMLLVDYILRQTEGMDIDKENHSGDTALIIACRWGKFKIVELLVQRGAEINLETSAGKTGKLRTKQQKEVYTNQTLILMYLQARVHIVDMILLHIFDFIYNLPL